MPHIVDHRYNQGLAAYRAGLSMRDIMNISDEIEVSAEKAMDEIRSRAMGGTPEEDAQRDAIRRERQDGVPSVIAGFTDGFIEDIRTLARSHRPQTGGKA